MKLPMVTAALALTLTPALTLAQDEAPEPGCLGTFTGAVTKLAQDYDYKTTKIATWPAQARFDARGGLWQSYMNGDYAKDPKNRKNTAPIQLGLDWGTNVDDAGRRDLWRSNFNTPPQKAPLCWHGGLVVGTQPISATWGELKFNGGGYAISVNSLGATVEHMRVHNQEDGFMPYQSNGFVYRHNWQSYTRDDCIENDGGAGGRIVRNLFDGCFVFYSNDGGGIDAGGPKNTVTIANNLIRMEPMPGPPFGGAGLYGDRNRRLYGVVLKLDPDPGKVAKLIVRNNVLALEAGGVKNVIRAFKDRIGECSGNTILWLGPGEFPYQADLVGKIAGCFKVVSGPAARDQWQKAKAEWIAAHPNMPAVQG